MKQKRATAITQNALLVLLVAICLGPLLLVLINSFKTHTEIVGNPLTIAFTGGIQNYADAWDAANFRHTIMNSAIYCGSTILITLACAIPAAYVISTRKVKGTTAVQLYFMIAMTVPVQLFLVPLYRTYASWKLLGNLVAVSFILSACYLPLGISLLRAFFLNIPREMEEAARIDGAGTFQVIKSIIFPIISPGIITVAIIVGLNAWNEFLVSSTFLIGERNFTAMLALLAINGVNNANHGLNTAATVTLVGPLILFFIFMQKQFIDGIVSGSVKG